MHEALEMLHREEADLLGFLGELPPKVRGELENEVLPNYKGTTTWAEASATDHVVTESNVDSILELDGGSVVFRGKLDLLYRTKGEWVLVDFKTGRIAEENTFLYDSYRWQLASYSWLLMRVYGIGVSRGQILYVHPDVHTQTMDINLEAFEQAIRAVPQRLQVVTGEGLRPDPDPDPETYGDEGPPRDSRCGTCPFGFSVAGICEFG